MATLLENPLHRCRLAPPECLGTPADVLDSLQCPDWTVRTGQQWELYVDPSIRRLWDSLTDEARTVAFIAAVSQLLDDR